MEVEFIEFPKIARLSRECIITEKIDGTNACIYIREGDGSSLEFGLDTQVEINGVSHLIRAGSRSRWISPHADNFGFAAWVYRYANELKELGPGRHFGEWWGSGIQRGYGLANGEKRFSLFNVQRWALHGTEPKQIPQADPRVVKMQDVLPACVGLVPELYRGEFETFSCEVAIDMLRRRGSMAVPGFMKPEGIVCFHIAGNVGFKKTLERDAEPKSKVA